MLKADAITQRILDDARRDAARTLEEANARAESLRKAAESALAKKREQMSEQTKLDAQLNRSRMLRMAELEARKAMLGAKREVIDQVFDTVQGGMKSMPADQRMAYNKRILLEAAQGGEQILCAEEDVELFAPAYLSDVNQQLARRGKAPVSLGDERRNTGGGFILKNGGMEINCCYAEIIAQHRQSMEADVAAALFGAGREVN